MNPDIEHDRVEALRVPCPHRLPTAGKGDPWVCGAQVGEPCRNRLTGRPLERFAAHNVRLVAAGRAYPSTVPRPAR